MEKEFLEAIVSHQGIIHKVCRLYRDTKEDREDLFQEIVFQVWKSFKSFDGRSAISTWIYKIALNTAISKFRKKSRFTLWFEPEMVKLEKKQVLENEHDLRKEALYEAIANLDKLEKAIVMLYLDDLNYQDIAEIIGVTENYVGVKLNRIKGKLRKTLTGK